MVSRILSLGLPDLTILVVDDNSPDGTGKIADDLAGQHPQVQVLHRGGKQGLGRAYLHGFKVALEKGATFICQMDTDFSHPPEKLIEMLGEIPKHDIVIGSRYVPGGSVDEAWPVWRKWLSAFGNVYARTILRLPVKDATGGYRLWRREALQKIPFDRVRANGYAFQVEMTYIGHLLGFSFKEIPIYFAERNFGESKMSFRIQVEAAVRVWQMLLEYRDLKKQ